ncbi:MAG: LLM class flavin-dependent oxidoreductase [Candidatus Caldarchaeales archaeon]|nr:LLM class flavin-dependent oxidoreductase [Candidatus Caldarchaeales archaeon]
MRRRRTAIGLSIPNFSLTASRTIAGTAEKAGFDSVWVNDDLVGVFQKETFDPYLCMAVMAESTRRVSVGSAVLATYRKHPVETALKLISLDNLSRGRLIAGLGSCCPSEQWGFPAREDVNDRFAEFIVLLKKLLTSDNVHFEGEFFKVQGAGFAVRPYRGRSIPVWAAANTDKALRTIAKVADGWLPICIPPTIYSEELHAVREAAEESGRRGGEIVAGCMSFIHIAKRREMAREKSHRLLAQTACWFNSARTRKLGLGVFKSPDQVPVDVVEKLNIVGTVEDAAARIGEYLDAEVEHLVLQPVPVEEIKAMIPRIAGAVELAR